MTHDDETVERIARLIYDADALRPRLTWERLTPLTQGEYRREARAALSAMPERELLREALSALDRVLLDVEFMWEDGTLPNRRDDVIYVRARAAADKIRAALTQEKQP